MSILSLAIILLIIFGFIFFFVFAYACTIWTDRNPKEAKNIFTGTMVSLFYTFKFFLIGLFLIILLSFFLK